MIIIINSDKSMNRFEKINKLRNNVIIIDSFCQIKSIINLLVNTDNNILIINSVSFKEEEVKKYLIEEILISINIDIIFSNYKDNKLEEISQFYQIPLIYSDF